MTRSDPFHEGERAVQERVGVRSRAEVMGQRMIRTELIDQHRAFYAELPFLVLGSVDDRGRPWASIVAGQPGFLSTPDAHTLDVAAIPVAGDPLAGNLRDGADIGVLGMQLETRRRNRMSGQISEIRPDGFSLSVLQAFGNCPQYIQTRDVALVDAGPPSVKTSERFDDQTADILTRADTLFIATSYRSGEGVANQGTDVSHRGGKPGFVKIENDRTFIFPDFKGNNAFNTIGNLEVNPRAGFLVPDFETQSLVTMTGAAEMIWDGPEVEAFMGAKRLMRFRAEEVHRIKNGLAFETRFNEYARQLEQTGGWSAGN